MNYYPPQVSTTNGVNRYGFTQGQYGDWTKPATGPSVVATPQAKMKAPPIGTTERVPYLYPPGSIQAFFGRHALLFGILMTVIAFLLFNVLGAFTPIFGLEGEILTRLLTCLAIVGIFWMMGMSGEMRPTLVGIRTSMTLGLYPILTSLFIGTVIQGWGPSAYVQSLLSPSGLIVTVELLIMCLLIGGFEEMLTRGIFLSGLQSRLGKSSRGLYAAAYISAILFGMLHVISAMVAIAMGDLPLNGSIILQMVLKTIQTGMLGVLLAAITIRTHSIWGAVVIHALDDFFLMLPAYLSGAAAIGRIGGAFPVNPLLADEQLGQYVTGDPDQAFALIVSYVVISLIYLPYLFTAGKLIRAARIPDTGAMCEEYVAHEIEEYDNKKTLVFMYPLMPLVPQWQAPAPQQMAVPYQMQQRPYWASSSSVAPTINQVAWQTMPQPTWGQPQMSRQWYQQIYQQGYQQYQYRPQYRQQQAYPQRPQQAPARQPGGQQWQQGVPQQGGQQYPQRPMRTQPYQQPQPYPQQQRPPQQPYPQVPGQPRQGGSPWGGRG